MKKKMQVRDSIKSVMLTICAKDGRKLEIPLEVWQIGVICEMLGLSVDTTSLDTYSMRSKEQVEEEMEMYHEFIRNLHKKEWDDTE